MTAGVAVPIEALATLRRRLAVLPGRHPQRETLLSSTAELYGISRATLYRLLRGERRPRDAHRADRGTPRVMPAAEIERWCEIVAAMKVRTTNRKGRHLSTVRILQLLVEHGVETPDGLQQLAPGRLTVSQVGIEGGILFSIRKAWRGGCCHFARFPSLVEQPITHRWRQKGTLLSGAAQRHNPFMGQGRHGWA
jgi:hypothetical protein